MAVYVLCMVLFCIGIYAVVSKRNLIRIIIGIMISENAINLFFIATAYRIGGSSPIFSPAFEVTDMVDPLPHALVLTAIVIGLATTALMVALAMRLHEKYGTFDIAKIRELRG